MHESGIPKQNQNPRNIAQVVRILSLNLDFGTQIYTTMSVKIPTRVIQKSRQVQTSKNEFILYAPSPLSSVSDTREDIQ